MEDKIKDIQTIEELLEYLISLDLETLIYKSTEIINISFYFGLKEYEYVKRRSKILSFNNYNDIINLYVYDIKLKELILSKILFIESSLKSTITIILLSYLKSDKVKTFLESAIESYSNSPSFYNEIQKLKSEENYTKIKNIIFQNNSNTNSTLIAIKEMSFGQLGLLYKCLISELREKIRDSLNINVENDTNKELIGDYIYLLKNLRNACAHNNIIYDSRFKESRDIKDRMKINLVKEIKVFRLNFNDIIDYIILISYFLKHLGLNKKEIYEFVLKFENITNTLYKLISKDNLSLIEIKLLKVKLNALKKYIFF